MAIIREYSPLDYPQVRKNLETAGIFYEKRDSQVNYNSLAETDEGIVLVADSSGKIAGSVVAQQFGESLAHVWAMAVAKGYRRQGIAIALASTLEHQLRTIGVSEVWGFVDVENVASRALLRKLGYETDPTHKYYGPWKEL